MIEFEKFGKISRLSRDIVITEKIDGTNAQVMIINKAQYEEENYNPNNPDMTRMYLEDVKGQAVYENFEYWILAGSRKKWLDTSSKGDNFGFAKWVRANGEELIRLGEGRHYGEWYGLGINRNYGLDKKHFALFNVAKWDDSKARPKCCEVVPVLYRGLFRTEDIEHMLQELKENGSYIAPKFMNPEGIIIYHTASGKLFKKTILNDEKPKEQVKREQKNEIQK